MAPSWSLSSRGSTRKKFWRAEDWACRRAHSSEHRAAVLEQSGDLADVGHSVPLLDASFVSPDMVARFTLVIGATHWSMPKRQRGRRSVVLSQRWWKRTSRRGGQPARVDVLPGTAQRVRAHAAVVNGETGQRTDRGQCLAGCSGCFFRHSRSSCNLISSHLRLRQ
jgi:hypothetical protein